jgi:U4/U6 small nuclear ribonucleoprotein PRP31
MLADLDDLSDDEILDEAFDEKAKEGEAVKRERDGKGGGIATTTDSELYERVMRVVNDEKNGVTRVEDGEKMDVVQDCNKLVVDIDNDIVNAYNVVRDTYRPKFPELESLVEVPLDYVSVVRLIGNETDLTLVPLDSILPSSSVMIVTVAATTTTGCPLPDEALQRVLNVCDAVLRLDADKSSILGYLERSMGRVAPNLTACVGSEVAAKLMGIAGGLQPLATMPACNVQVLGAKRKHAAGLSSKSAGKHQGFVYDSGLVQDTPPSLRAKAAKLVGSKCSLLARVDAHGNHKDGSIGEKIKEEIERKIEKWQEPPPARKAEVLAVPDAEEMKKTKRGGRKVRKMKEKYGMTELKKQANRMLFNQMEDEFLDGEEAIGLGAVGKAGIRVAASQQKQKLSAKARRKFGLDRKMEGTSGLSSSLAFTPVVGIELADPDQAKKKEQVDGTKSVYFSDTTGFHNL